MGKARKIRIEYRQRLTLRQKLLTRKVIVSCSAAFLLFTGSFIYYQFAGTTGAYASVAGDYRSKASGNWNSLATWETYNGTAWVNATSTPTASSGNINIVNGDTVTVTVTVSADQITVEQGGLLVISSGKTFTITNGTGNDLILTGNLIINGTYTCNASQTVLNGTITLSAGASNNYSNGGTISINNGARYIRKGNSMTTTANIWTVNAGGVFQQDINGGNLPLATWNSGSTCEITGVTNTRPGNIAQNYYHFTWNCLNQTSMETLQGNLNTINGDCNFLSTGTGSVRLGQSESYALNIGGNLIIQSGTVFATGNGNPTINLTGSLEINGGSLNMTDAANGSGAGSPNFNINGNLQVSSGTFNLNQNTTSSSGKGITTLNLTGNFIQTGGTITETANTGANYGFGKINFTKQGTQILNRTNGILNNVIDFTVGANTTLDMGTSVLTGNGSFTKNGDGSLIIGSPNGLSTTPSSGNIQLTGARTFSNTMNYYYKGTSPQITGDGLPSVINNLTIENSNGVSLTNNLTLNGTLTLTVGKLITNANEIIVTNTVESSITGYSADNYVSGNLRRYINPTGSYDFPVGTGANYELINVTLSGATGFTSLTGSFTNASPINPSYPLAGLMAGNNPVDTMLDYGYWTVTPNSVMTGGTYNVTLKQKGHLNGGNPNSYSVLKRNNFGSPWESLGIHDPALQHEQAGVATAVRSGLTSFSQFGIGKNSAIGALPIKLLYFNAKLNNSVVNLSWATANERSNDFFTIERSMNGKEFEILLTKKGAGNSTTTLYYSAQDESPFENYTYYRLKQTDYNGHFTYSPIKEVMAKSSSENENALKIISVAPNPFTDFFITNFIINTSVQVNISILNSSGQSIFNDIINANEGINSYEFTDHQNLPPDIYFIVLMNKNEKAVTKLLKK